MNYNIGVSLASMDSKNRITLPKSMIFNENDKVILLEDFNILSMYHEEYFMRVIEQLDKNELHEFKDFLILKRQYDTLLSNVLARGCIDKQRRILIPKLIADSYQLKDSVFICGAYDHINIFKDKETFQKSKNRVK